MSNDAGIRMRPPIIDAEVWNMHSAEDRIEIVQEAIQRGFAIQDDRWILLRRYSVRQLYPALGNAVGKPVCDYLNAFHTLSEARLYATGYVEGRGGGELVVRDEQTKIDVYSMTRSCSDDDAVWTSLARRFLTVDRTSIQISDEQWRDTTEDHSVLFATIEINGTVVEVEAHATAWQNNWQVGAGEHSNFDELNRASGVDNPQLETVIRGRKYVIFAHAQGTCT